MTDPLDSPSHDERQDDYDADHLASADPLNLETITGEFLGLSYDTEPDTMVLRLRVSAEDVKRTLTFVGGRGVLTLEKAEDLEDVAT